MGTQKNRLDETVLLSTQNTCFKLMHKKIITILHIFTLLSSRNYWLFWGLTNRSFFRWDEVTRKIELWAEIQEVNEQGEYTPVEVKPQVEVPSAGIYQLRQVMPHFKFHIRCRYT